MTYHASEWSPKKNASSGFAFDLLRDTCRWCFLTGACRTLSRLTLTAATPQSVQRTAADLRDVPRTPDDACAR